MSIWPQPEEDGHRIALSVSFKPGPNAEPFSFEKLKNGDYDDRLEQMFGSEAAHRHAEDWRLTMENAERGVEGPILWKWWSYEVDTPSGRPGTT